MRMVPAGVIPGKNVQDCSISHSVLYSAPEKFMAFSAFPAPQTGGDLLPRGKTRQIGGGCRTLPDRTAVTGDVRLHG